MTMSIVIRDEKHVKSLISAMQTWWAKSLHILADFDRTLTKWFYEWKVISSIASFLYEDGTMSREYQEKGKQLFDYYYPIEIDHAVDAPTKKHAMEQWRDEHLKLMVQYKLSRDNIDHVASHKELQLRDRTLEFFNILATNKIPTIIMSASGIGYDSIGLFLEKQWIVQTYIDVLSNVFIRDDNGYAIGRKWPVIHSMNKSETSIHAFPDVYAKISNRKNVILLWDSLHDVEMIDGFDYTTCIKIWFCNDSKKEVQDLFIQAYDVVIFDDGDMSYPIEVLNQILQ